MIGDAAPLVRWVGLRLATTLPILLLSASVIFLVFQLLADPAVVELGRFADAESLARRRTELGLDRPLLTRLFEHLQHCLTLDLGFSQHLRRPVLVVMHERVGPTLGYAVPGTTLAMMTSIGTGLWVAERPHTLGATAVLTAATLLLSTSTVVLVLGGHELLTHHAGLGPAVGWPLAGSLDSPVPYLLVPALLFGLSQLGADLRHHHAVFSNAWDEPHLQGLRARGLSRNALRLRVLRGGAAGILARLAHRLPHLLVGSLLLEEVFNIPGLGELTLLAMRSSDLMLLQGVAMGLTLTTVAIQTLLELAAGALDPRARPWA
jgi:peptide/nickel transport system permease protein